MRRRLTLTGILGSVLAGALAAWFLRPARPVHVERVVFAHPDEVVKGDGFMVLADRRIFAVMAFLNAAGYDETVEGKGMHPVRARVRRLVQENLAKSPGKLDAWRRYYKTNPFGTHQYQDLALSYTADFPFRRIRPDGELGYPKTEQRVRDLPERLNDFWVAADLAAVWSEVKADYVTEIKKYDFDLMKRQLAFLWQYLRMRRTDSYVLVNIPSLLEKHHQGLAARYENYYYSVESPGAYSYDLNVHEYLHSVVNPLVKASYDEHRAKLQAYFEAGKGGPLTPTYQDPVIFTYECLVRAVDHRVAVKLRNNRGQARRMERRIAELTRDGLTLTQPFYRLLTDYEKSGKSFDQFLPEMLAKLPEHGQPH